MESSDKQQNTNQLEGIFEMVRQLIVHLWGRNGVPSLVCPESVALYWFFTGYYDREDIEIVFSNNTDMSPNGELPLLLVVEGSKVVNKVCGFSNIVDYLGENDVGSTAQIDNKALLPSALLQFTKNELNTLTEYQLYLNKQNYEAFTRKEFSQLLYWPLWYNTPLQNRSRANKKCTNLLIVLPGEDDDEEDKLDDAAKIAQSKTFKITQEKKQKQKDELKNVALNFQYMKKLSKTLGKWIHVRETILSNKVIPADLLMWANIYVQLKLPDGDKTSNHLSETMGTDFMNTLQSHLELCSNFEIKINQREPAFSEQGNVIMSIYHLANKFL